MSEQRPEGNYVTAENWLDELMKAPKDVTPPAIRTERENQLIRKRRKRDANPFAIQRSIFAKKANPRPYDD